jgi:hypothetical protein
MGTRVKFPMIQPLLHSVYKSKFEGKFEIFWLEALA